MSFQFSMRATHHDPSGYLYDNWGNAQKVTVVADTKQEAMTKAKVVLGKPPQGRVWIYHFDNIKEVQGALDEEAE
jgi:hypothetical protein